MKKGIRMEVEDLMLSCKVQVNDIDVIQKTAIKAVDDLKEKLGVKEIDFNELEKQGYEASISKSEDDCIYITITHKSLVIIEYKIIIYAAVGEKINVGFVQEKVVG